MLKCEDHPDQEVFVKITTIRTYVGKDGLPVNRKKYTCPVSTRTYTYICVAEIEYEDDDLRGDYVCDDVVLKCQKAIQPK